MAMTPADPRTLEARLRALTAKWHWLARGSLEPISGPAASALRDCAAAVESELAQAADHLAAARSVPPPVGEPDYWRCRACGCLWRDNHDGTVSLSAQKQKSCTVCEAWTGEKTCDGLYADQCSHCSAHSGVGSKPPTSSEQKETAAPCAPDGPKTEAAHGRSPQLPSDSEAKRAGQDDVISAPQAERLRDLEKQLAEADQRVAALREESDRWREKYRAMIQLAAAHRMAEKQTVAHCFVPQEPPDDALCEDCDRPVEHPWHEVAALRSENERLTDAFRTETERSEAYRLVNERLIREAQIGRP